MQNAYRSFLIKIPLHWSSCYDFFRINFERCYRLFFRFSSNNTNYGHLKFLGVNFRYVARNNELICDFEDFFKNPLNTTFIETWVYHSGCFHLEIILNRFDGQTSTRRRLEYFIKIAINRWRGKHFTVNLGILIFRGSLTIYTACFVS